MLIFATILYYFFLGIVYTGDYEARLRVIAEYIFLLEKFPLVRYCRST